MIIHFMAQNDFHFRIKSQIEETDKIEMNIPIFRGKGSGPSADEKVHRYDVIYLLLQIRNPRWIYSQHGLSDRV